MTKQQTIDKHLDRLAGILLDAAIAQRKGADLSLWMRATYAKLRDLIGDVVDDAQPAPLANGHANGVATPRRN